MIKCPKCGAENLVGAIFCRECGGKLDLNELKPEDFQKMGVPSSKKIIKRVKEWANSLMTLALIVFVVLVSWPPANTIARPEAPEEEQTAKLERKFKAVTNATRAMRFKFTPEEINYLTNTVYGFDPEKGKKTGPFVEKHLVLGPITETDITFTLRADLFSQIPTFTTVTFSLEKDTYLKPIKAKFGRMPAIGFFKNLAVKRFKQACQSDDAKKALGLIKGIQATEEGVSVTVYR